MCNLIAILVMPFSIFIYNPITWPSCIFRVCPELFAKQTGFRVKGTFCDVTTPILFKQILITTCDSHDCSSHILSRLKAWNFFADLFIDRFTDTQTHLLLRADCVARRGVTPLPFVFGNRVKRLHHFFVCSVFAAFLIFLACTDGIINVMLHCNCVRGACGLLINLQDLSRLGVVRKLFFKRIVRPCIVVARKCPPFLWFRQLAYSFMQIKSPTTLVKRVCWVIYSITRINSHIIITTTLGTPTNKPCLGNATTCAFYF